MRGIVYKNAINSKSYIFFVTTKYFIIKVYIVWRLLEVLCGKSIIKCRLVFVLQKELALGHTLLVLSINFTKTLA